MTAADKNVFSYQENKNGSVFIYWHGKQAVTLKGVKASKFIGKMKSASDEKEKQLFMAKITGNFKRGNEKVGRK